MINFDRAGDGRLHVCRALGRVYSKRQRQICDDACDSVLIENSGVASKWVANLFWSDFIVFNENTITSVFTALTLTLGVNGPLNLPVSFTHNPMRSAILTKVSNFISGASVNCNGAKLLQIQTVRVHSHCVRTKAKANL